ncbi:MAG: outer membrane protein assembly factor BamA [PVC group bacterium]|nr:outer membrane protein assembly factor BamA [PVC group bacterium]
MNKRGRIFIFIVLFICFCSTVFAQQPERIVRKIVVENNKVVSEHTIVSQLKTKEGLALSTSTLSDDIKRLYTTGLFKDVSADVEDMEKGVKVIFRVEEKATLKEIVFEGNRRLRTKKLLAKMQTKLDEVFDQFKLREDIEELKKFYAEKGYSLADITYKIEEIEQSVTVKITVIEGARVRVRKILFKGNSILKKGRLLKVVKTKRKGWFNSGFYKEKVLSEDTERLISFYRLEGFIDVNVNTLIDYNDKKSAMYITFEIKEGKQYKVGQISLGGYTIAEKDELKESLSMTEDAIYNELKLRDDISALQSFYFDKGYIASEVKVDTVLNAGEGSVDLSYGIDEGHVAYVDKVNVSGNTRTKDVVIRREMRLFPGDKYNGDKLKRSRQRLHNLGYFEEVTFDTAEKPTTLPDKHDLDIFVKESKTGEFSFGAGYSSVDQFIGFVDLTQRNFDLFNLSSFTGGGQRLRMRMEFGSDRKDYELGFVEPWFLGYPLTMGFNIYNRTRDWEKYDERRIGGNLFLGKEFGEYWNGKVSYRYEGVRISNILEDASADIKLEKGKNYISSVTSEVMHDTRDNVFNPTTGIYSMLSCEVGGGVLEGDKDFVKYYTKNCRYFPATEKAVLEFKGRAGYVESYSNTAVVPIYERFYVGGANTIRGYKERRVGPEGEFGDPIGGRIMFVFNAEYTYNLAKNLKWAFFYDNGNVWRRPSEFKWDTLKLKSSIGTGMRVKTPLGPIRLDYGYALNPKEGDSRGRFHFTMSQEF